MNNSKLVTVLRAFTKKDISRFKEFVGSAFFNKNKVIVILLDEICRYYPFDEDSEIAREKIFEALFPAEKFNEDKFKNLVSDLYELAEKFLVISSLNNNSYDFRKNLLFALRERNIDKVLLSCIKESEKKLDSFKMKDRNYFYYKWALESERNLYTSEHDRIKYGKNLQCEFDNFVNYMLIVMMEFYIRLINEEGYSKIKYQHSLQAEVLNLFTERFSKEPVLEIYYNTLMIRLTFEEKYFKRLKELKALHYDLLNKVDLYFINSNLQTFYLDQGNRGVSGYGRDYFELQKENLRDCIAIKTIPYILFINIVKTGGNLKEIKWVSDFIDEYGEMIPGKYRGATVNFCRAFVFYKKGEIDKSLEVLSKTRTEAMQISLEIKKLTCLIYYENGSHESALSMVDSLRHYVNSEKISPPELKELMLGFATFYKELIKLRIDNNRTGAGVLLKKIEEHSFVSNKAWLIEKAKQLVIKNQCCPVKK